MPASTYPGADQNETDHTTVRSQQPSTENSTREMDKRSVYKDKLSVPGGTTVVENEADTDRGHTKGQMKRRRKQGVVDSVWASG